MKVLIAVDGSAIAESTFKYYMENFHKEGNEIFVAYEAEQPPLPTVAFHHGASFPADEIAQIMTQHNKKRNDIENYYTMQCKHYNVKYKVFADSSNTKPGPAILKKADEVGASMIVMGSRGLGLLRRTMLGSVSNYVLHHSKIPVFIYRNPATQTQQAH